MGEIVRPKTPPSEKKVHRDLLIQVLWPDFSTQTPEYRKELNTPGGGRLMIALVSSGAKYSLNGTLLNSLDGSFESHLQGLRRFCYHNPSEFVNVSTPPICVDATSPVEKPDLFGLKRIGIDFDRYPMSEDEIALPMKEDLLYARNPNGQLTTFIKCMPDFPSRIDPLKIHHIPHCDQYFFVPALNAEVSVAYRKDYLESWRAIQDRWINLLSSFVKVNEKTIGKQ